MNSTKHFFIDFINTTIEKQNSTTYKVEFAYGKESVNNAEFQRSKTQTIKSDPCKYYALVTSESIQDQIVYMDTMVSLTPPTYTYENTSCSGDYVLLFTATSTPAFDLGKIAYNSNTGKIEIVETDNTKHGIF